MKLYYSFLSIAVSIIMPLGIAQPNVALENKLTRPVYYSIGSPADRALNKNLETLYSKPGSKTLYPAPSYVAVTLPEDSFQAGVEVLLSSKPGEAVLFAFTPGKTVYVDIKEDKENNVLLTPQTGTATSLWRKTEQGYPLSNNVTTKDIAKASLTSLAIPVTNPNAFEKIYKGATWRSVLNAYDKDPKQIKTKATTTESQLREKWYPTQNRSVLSLLDNAWKQFLDASTFY